MNREEAEEYAKKMTYRDAVNNALRGKSIPYRKATLIKLHEWLDLVERRGSVDKVLDKIRAEITEKENKLGCACVSDVALKNAYIEVLQIIDKYRQEG
ncbi:MAG: hypothetical protein K6D96_03920 [Acetatifactor sp.]|nr:hypothetical protein [Acetatifactor sp.]